MSESGRRVLVIGGGVIGVACAHYLHRAGWQPTIIDQSGVGQACSHGNCGLVCPSHVLPLAQPGALWEALQALVNPAAAFRIKPRLDLRLWAWLWQFARRCHRADMIRAGHALHALLKSSMSAYEDLLANEPLACEWQRHGLLFVYQTKRALDDYAATDTLLRDTFHEGAERIDGDTLCAREPALKPGLAGGWYYEADAHLRPDRLMASWKALLQQRGVTIHEGCAFRAFVRRDGRAVAVQTSHGEMAAEAFVVATGAFTPLLEAELGQRIPIQPGKGYSLTMPRPSLCPRVPLLLPEHRVAVTPFESGYRLGSIMEFAGYDDSIHPKRLALLRDGARHYLREPEAEPIQEQWFGWRPMTWDSLPIIDRLPTLPNVLIAAGHNMLGLSMAPATGKLAAELLSEKPPHLDPQPYSLRRF